MLLEQWRVNSNSSNIRRGENGFGCSNLNWWVFSPADIRFRLMSIFTTKDPPPKEPPKVTQYRPRCVTQSLPVDRSVVVAGVAVFWWRKPDLHQSSEWDDTHCCCCCCCCCWCCCWLDTHQQDKLLTRLIDVWTSSTSSDSARCTASWQELASRRLGHSPCTGSSLSRLNTYNISCNIAGCRTFASERLKSKICVCIFMDNPSQCGASLAIRKHTRHRWTRPALTPTRYAIHLPRRDGKLSWPLYSDPTGSRTDDVRKCGGNITLITWLLW